AGFRVIAPERCGLYYFHAETPSGKFLSFPWVVAPARPQAKIAAIASTNTWNAYNNFGGRSNYINPTALPPAPTVNARQDLSRYINPEITVWHDRDEKYAPLSFERPEPFNHIPKDVQLTDPIRGRQACHLAEAEWRLLGWLERAGFDYDLYADYQLHAGEFDLDAYDVLILSTHPEYWSRDAYTRVKQWVHERGGKLMYLGGNGIDCEVELPDDKTMRCRTWLSSPAGVPMRDEKTGETYDCRFHRTVESPAKLLGVVFSAAGATTGAPYRVVNSSHWIFEGTGMKDGDVFGAASLHERCPGGASGHETDKRTASSPANAHIVARGMNSNNGGAEIVYFDTPTQGAVFSVGSINWPASILVDPIVSAMTRNVLKRFLKG
ncbi:MAG TPA: N,N-dimethylformamidase beta subunit family domain-containing protein, partial [Tepidisphaeraceae bacterium]|nr:N,N-dimethylformamidase beta subunit family domain-containing protein [Tepidisphaeraceae bacterium]